MQVYQEELTGQHFVDQDAQSPPVHSLVVPLQTRNMLMSILLIYLFFLPLTTNMLVRINTKMVVVFDCC